jgi:hypothetical protein
LQRAEEKTAEILGIAGALAGGLAGSRAIASRS